MTRAPACVRPSHLFFGTRTDNSDDKVAKGRQKAPPPMLGERHPLHVLTESRVRKMRTEYAKGGITHQELAERHHCTKGTVGFILRRETWRHV